MKDDLTFSVIVPVNHGYEFLEKALRSIVALNYPHDRYEVIVAGSEVDTSSREVAQSIRNTYPGSMKYVSHSSSNRSGKLNAACAAARGRILACTDEDCIVPEEWLNTLEKIFSRESHIGLVGGPDRGNRRGSVISQALECVFRSFTGTGGCARAQVPGWGPITPSIGIWH